MAALKMSPLSMMMSPTLMPNLDSLLMWRVGVSCDHTMFDRGSTVQRTQATFDGDQVKCPFWVVVSTVRRNTLS